MQVKLKQATSMIIKCIKARKVPMLIGSPGCGKSQAVHAIAKQFNLKVIDLRLSQCDPTDLNGFPNIKGTRASYLPMDTFPIEGDEIPEGYSGWLLFLDEFNAASTAVQAAAYKIVLDKMVGQNHLHKNVAIVCAGNKDSDGAITNEMSTALQSRLIHIETMPDLKEWMDWANENGINHMITSHLNFKPGNLYTFKPDHTDKTYACLRTWEFANDILEHSELDDPDTLPLLAGTLGEGVAREFLTYTKIYKNLITVPQIENNPEKAVMPTEPSILWAITGSIAEHATKENLKALMVFINRMPVEFQVVTNRAIVRRNKPLAAHPSMQEWISKAAMELI